MVKKLFETASESLVMVFLSRISSVVLLPVLGFIAAYMFNGIEQVKIEQSNTNVHIAVIETTLPAITDKIKANSDRLNKVADNVMSLQEQNALDKAAARDLKIKKLQSQIKKLTDEDKPSNSEKIKEISSKLKEAMLESSN